MSPTWRGPPNGIEKSSAWRSGCSTRARARRREHRSCSATRKSMCGRATPTRSSGSPRTIRAAGSDDLCFLTASTPDEVVAHLKAHGVAIEQGPVAKQGARGTLRSVYCRDPDGSLIEISSYEDEAAEPSAAANLADLIPDARPVAELLPSNTPKAAGKAAREDQCRIHRQRRASSDRSQGSTCRGCCGCGPRRGATIRS